MKISSNIPTALAIALMTACGGGSGSDPQSGTFINSPTKGLSYSSSPSGLSGTTDENGKFLFQAGDTVSFSLNLGAVTLQLGSVTNPSAETSVLSLVVPGGGDSLAVAQLLETLDIGTSADKMDVSGISLPAENAALGLLSSALLATSSSANIAAIAAAVQTAVTVTGSSLKYGTSGVSLSEAMSNLANNPANQVLIETKVQDLPSDGTPLTDIVNKVSYTSWIQKKGGVTKFTARFGGLGVLGGEPSAAFSDSPSTFRFQHPINTTQSELTFGSYVLAPDLESGTWSTLADDGGVSNSGTFGMKRGDPQSFVLTYTDSLAAETGIITGIFLKPLLLMDLHGVTFTIPLGCLDGLPNTITVNLVGGSSIASDRCNSQVNGSTWAAGPFDNTVKYTEISGRQHILGITRITKPANSNGNVPNGSTGSFISVSNTNFDKQPAQISFSVASDS